MNLTLTGNVSLLCAECSQCFGYTVNKQIVTAYFVKSFAYSDITSLHVAISSEKLIFAQQVNQFLVFYGARTFTAIFIRSRHWTSRLSLGPPHRILSCGYQWPGREADHSRLCSTGFKNPWSCTSINPVSLHGVVLN